MSEKSMQRLLARGARDGVAEMRWPQMGSWIDRLPVDEFLALLDAHAAMQSGSAELPVVSELDVDTIPALPPDDDGWTVYVDEGALPLPEDAQCFVLFADGEYAGPNRADAFLWGGDGQAQIVAFQPAGLIH